MGDISVIIPQINELIQNPLTWIFIVVLFITLIAECKIFNKVGVQGIHAWLPILNPCSLCNNVLNGGVTCLLFILYVAMIGLVAYTFLATPVFNTYNVSLVLAVVIYFLQSLIWFKTLKGFRKNLIMQLLAFVPGISLLIKWYLGFSSNNLYAKDLDIDAISKLGYDLKDLYPMLGIDGQDAHHPDVKEIIRDTPRTTTTFIADHSYEGIQKGTAVLYNENYNPQYYDMTPTEEFRDRQQRKLKTVYLEQPVEQPVEQAPQGNFDNYNLNYDVSGKSQSEEAVAEQNYSYNDGFVDYQNNGMNEVNNLDDRNTRNSYNFNYNQQAYTSNQPTQRIVKQEAPVSRAPDVQKQKHHESAYTQEPTQENYQQSDDYALFMEWKRQQEQAKQSAPASNAQPESRVAQDNSNNYTHSVKNENKPVQEDEDLSLDNFGGYQTDELNPYLDWFN